MMYKKIEVTWEDITFFKGVYTNEELKGLQIQILKTIGYLIKEDKKYIYLAMTLEITEPFRLIDIYQIPKTNIIKKRGLKWQIE